MKNSEQRFTIFVNISLKFLFFIILIGSIVFPIQVLIRLSKIEILRVSSIISILIAMSLGVIVLVKRYLRKNKNYTRMIVVILGISLILRITWIMLVDTKPFSDFGLIYEAGKRFANGDYWVFKGISYISRFPHLTIITIYLGLIQKLFTNALLVIKLVNVTLSTVNVYLIYLIGTDLYNDKKKGILVALLACFFPPFIIYNSVVCSENLAMPFFLGSIYVFTLVTKRKRNILWFSFSGLLLSIGNLFRMVAYVIVIAYIMYLIIYWVKKKFAKSCVLILLSFFIPLYITNTALLDLGITENPLWKGREPFITSVLKGTNINSLGMWNKEDSELPALYNYDYAAVETASKDIIINRLTTTPLYKLIAFYIVKFMAQWSFGDFYAVSWATGEQRVLSITPTISTFIFLYSQILFILVILYTCRGLFNYKQYLKNKFINLFYMIFCGYGLFYLITEQQPRYGYIISWVFILFAFTYSEESNPE